jgi:hypothetical protein
MMSSTLRGYDRHKSDYYVTPDWIIDELFDAIPELFEEMDGRIALDPCAGGGIVNGSQAFGMPYPEALKRRGWNTIHTMDVREDSLAEIKHDFLQWDTSIDYDLIITNPPFAIAEEITRKALSLADPESGKVIMLQRLNWLGSASRDDFFTEYPPSLIVMHAKRPSFGGTSSTDSIEYAHFIWDNTDKSGCTQFVRIRADNYKTQQTLF